MFLQDCFYICGKKANVTLSNDKFGWDFEGTPGLGQNFLISEIVSCWFCPKGDVTCFNSPTGATTEKDDSSFRVCRHTLKNGASSGALSVEVCERAASSCRWLSRVIVFMHSSKEIISAWHSTLWNAIQGLVDRPNKLLIIVNPISGIKRGLKIYQRKLLPLFHRARIDTSMIQTQYKGHATPLMLEAYREGELSEVDGVVAVGGDGLVSEMARGLLICAAEAKGLDPHSPNTNLPATHLRIGIVPCGSTDSICYATHGINDVPTSLLHIVMGDNRPIDVAAVHTDGKLQRVATTIISYGYLGDLLLTSEQLRFLGPPRYLLSGLKQIFNNKSHRVSLKIKTNEEIGQVSQSNTVRSSVTCTSLCNICSQVEAEKEDIVSDNSWKEVTDDYVIVTAAVTSCACKITPKGVSPSAHLGDGSSDLILVKGSSRSKLLSYMYHTIITGNASQLSHVDVIRTNEIQFSASPGESSFNCDGEVLQASNINIKIHRQKLKLFCRGVEETLSPSGKMKTDQYSCEF